MVAPHLDRRALNRATLARQGLLSRIAGTPLPVAVAQVGSLQAQHPDWPPVALWARYGSTGPSALVTALEERTVVRAALMRITVHIVAAHHFWAIATLTQPLRQAQFRTFFKADTATSRVGRRLTATHAAVLAALREDPLRIRDMDAIMRAGAPELADAPNRMQWRHLAATIPLVHVPFEGEGYGRSRYALAETWIGPSPDDLDESAATRLVAERYLAAFGPASVEDLIAYVGRRGAAARWRAALAALGDRLVSFRAEDGRELLDLADAPRPGADAAAPPRLLARWDSLLLSHAPARRERIIAEEHRAAVYSRNADVLPTLLVDGMVAGTWERSGATVTLRPFAALDRDERRALETEAAQLATTFAPRDEPRLVIQQVNS